MSEEDLERYESDVELQIYREYRDVLPMFRFVIETERRFYLANGVELNTREAGGAVYFELELEDAWVWDMYRPARFLKNVRVLTFRDVNVEELEHPELADSSQQTPLPPAGRSSLVARRWSLVVSHPPHTFAACSPVSPPRPSSASSRVPSGSRLMSREASPTSRVSTSSGFPMPRSAKPVSGSRRRSSPPAIASRTGGSR